MNRYYIDRYVSFCLFYNHSSMAGWEAIMSIYSMAGLFSSVSVYVYVFH